MAGAAVTRSVLITGASTGIGRATALLLADRAFAVTAGVRRDEDADALRAADARIRTVVLDVTDPVQIAAAASALHRLDAVVNNAGVVAPMPLEHLRPEELRHQLEVNVVGQLAVTQAVLPLLKASRGRIVMMSSIGGRLAGGMIGAYHASKFALEAIVETLRVELAPWQVQTTAIEPGPIATPIWSKSAAVGDAALADRPDAQRDYAQPLDRSRRSAAWAAEHGLPPEQVARTVLRALDARRMKTRYPVGGLAWMGSRVVTRLPDAIAERVRART